MLLSAVAFVPMLRHPDTPQELQIELQLTPVAELRYIPGATTIQSGGTGVGVAVGKGVLVGKGHSCVKLVDLQSEGTVQMPPIKIVSARTLPYQVPGVRLLRL